MQQFTAESYYIGDRVYLNYHKLAKSSNFKHTKMWSDTLGGDQWESYLETSSIIVSHTQQANTPNHCVSIEITHCAQ